jgi:hypothetical protein
VANLIHLSRPRDEKEAWQMLPGADQMVDIHCLYSKLTGMLK